MSINKTTHHAEPDVVQKARGFWLNYSKPVSYASAAIIVLLGGWLIYKYMFKMPKEDKANDNVYTTQKYFSDFTNATSDSTKAALAVKCLNGDGRNDGALRIINKYSGTEAANLCEYYAGACYLHLHQYAKAIKFLKDFKAGGATQIKSRAYGMIGDASAELNKNEDALDYYKKAAAVNDKDEFTSSEYLFRAALFAESVGKTNDAIELFRQVKEKYPLSERANDVDRYLARLGNFSE
ncbi:MAG TPA: tetratricopeptide repeat protein [Chitinophagaceae bacterium]|nr:tetratricopeptide repeat protein [Chitinophagaceae bacterium]